MDSTKILIAKLKGAERNLGQQLEISTDIASSSNYGKNSLNNVHVGFYSEYKDKVAEIIKEFEDGLEISNNK